MQQITHRRKTGRAAALLLCIIALLAGGVPVQAGTPGTPEPQMVKDLREGANGSVPEDMAVIGATLFFSANDGLIGRELWRTSPPYTSVQKVADICPGGCASDPGNLAVDGTTLFFTANDGEHGFELWKSEPPYVEGTTFMIADIHPEGNSNPAEITPIGTAIFFSADNGKDGVELWRSDQPYNSAYQVKDIGPGSNSSNPSELTRIGWMLFFAAEDDSGVELWRSDPPYSSASTKQVVDINTEGSANINWLTPLDLKLFFSATDGKSGQELWVIDTPYHEARRVTDILGEAPSSNPNRMYALGDTLFFTAWIGISGYELFRSEPPYEPTTTFLVDDLSDTLFGSFPDEKVAIGSTLFFNAEGSDGVELYKSTPTYIPETTDLVMDIVPGPGSSYPVELTPIGTTLFFNAYDPRHGFELWKSEPPYNQLTTQLVFDLIEGDASSDPYNLTAIDRTLFFGANSSHLGRELFRFGGAYAMPATGFAPRRVSAVAAQPVDKAYRAINDLRLEIPALTLETNIVGVPVSADGWGLEWLAQDIGYLEGTAFPGWAGNSVLTGHVYLPNGAPGPFHALGRLRFGDRVVLHSYGQRYTYEVRAVESIDPTDVDAVFQHEEHAWLTLITCQGYDEQSGQYTARLVVRAVLLKVEPQ